MTDKELFDALQAIAEHFSKLEDSIAKIAAGLFALKAIAAHQLSPASPIQGLKQIEELEAELAKIDPTAPTRQQAADVLEAVRLFQKHGGGTS